MTPDGREWFPVTPSGALHGVGSWSTPSRDSKLNDPPEQDDAKEMKRTRRALRTLFAAALGATLAVAGMPLAPAPADTTTIDDPADGVAGYPDIETAEASHGETKAFRHTVTTYGAFDTQDAPCLQLRSLPAKVDYRLCGNGRIVRVSNGAHVGDATVARPDETTIVYEFGKKAIGDTNDYRWRAAVLNDACPQGVCDRAPDDGYEAHRRWVTYEQWAGRFFDEMRVSGCQNNRIAVIAWETNEGTQAVFNPLATTYPMPGSTKFNSTGVRNYISMGQGLDATRLTLERGWQDYGYGAIVRKLEGAPSAMRTAKAIRASEWCGGCSGGEYVTALIPVVKANYPEYAGRHISTG